MQWAICGAAVFSGGSGSSGSSGSHYHSPLDQPGALDDDVGRDGLKDLGAQGEPSMGPSTMALDFFY